MRLIRGWEKRYAPQITGGLRLSTASLYRALGDEEGLGDRREGEVRTRQEGEVSITWQANEAVSQHALNEMEKRNAPQTQEQIREMLATEWDDPELQLQEQGVARWKTLQNVKIDDSRLASPLLFCLSREPRTKADWEKLKSALPERYDTWTMTDDLDKLNFEIECGIKRWMGLNEIMEHKIVRRRGWVVYSYDSAPRPSSDFAEIAHMDRWFRKGRGYADEREYRLAWNLYCPQWGAIPETIDIELTRTGLGLFLPWNPPEV